MDKIKKRILIVDDEPDIREFISYNLKKKGYEVFTAQNGKDGFDLAVIHCPHLILLDLLMPEMNGFQTCINLRKIPILSKTKIIFLSALSESHAIDLGVQLDVDAYINKPIRIELLLKRIDYWMKQAG